MAAWGSSERSQGMLGDCQLRLKGRLCSMSPGQRSLCPESQSREESAHAFLGEQPEDSPAASAWGSARGRCSTLVIFHTLSDVSVLVHVCTHTYTHAPLVCAYLLVVRV